MFNLYLIFLLVSLDDVSSHDSLQTRLQTVFVTATSFLAIASITMDRTIYHSSFSGLELGARPL